MEAAGGGDAPGHGGGIVGEAEAAVGAEEDDAAVSAESVVEVGDGLAGRDFRGRACSDAVGGPLAQYQFHDGFAPAGERNGGSEVVGITAAPDEGRVADATGGFVEGAAGGGGGGQIAACVEGNGTHGIVAFYVGGRRWVLRLPGPQMRGTWGTQLLLGTSNGRIECGLGVFIVAVSGEGGIGEAGGLAGLCIGEALAFAIEDEFGVIDQFHTVGVGKAFRAFPDEVDMGALFEDEARGVDGVAQVFDAGDATGFHAASIHEEGVELNAAVGGEEAAASGVEGGIVFEDGDSGFDGVDGSAAAGEDFVTDFEGVSHAGFVGGCCIGGDSPCSAMNEKGGVVGGGEGCHSRHGSRLGTWARIVKCWGNRSNVR